MIHLLIYDIDKDSVRTKIADACEGAGLERVQFSAFWGELTQSECEELLLRCRELIGDEEARIHILPLCSKCFAGRTHYATGAYEGVGEAPRSQNETLITIPSTPPGKAKARRPTAKPRELPLPAPRPQADDESPAVSPAEPQDRSVPAAQADVARRLRRKNRPVGTDTDPWAEDTDPPTDA